MNGIDSRFLCDVFPRLTSLTLKGVWTSSSISTTGSPIFNQTVLLHALEQIPRLTSLTCLQTTSTRDLNQQNWHCEKRRGSVYRATHVRLGTHVKKETFGKPCVYVNLCCKKCKGSIHNEDE
jgi:hypothetical protein